ncbi:DUF6875 domain-containing protein [Trinickia sp.]|uniref:DUF6875 domain-containing protein n=1 Tax=Trinickia sp. TaxID=2571163 RepID=UPI003F7DF80C
MNEQNTGTSMPEPVSLALADMERSLRVSTEIDAIADTPLRDLYATGLAWMQRFIMRPHADLGRKGAVCPFAKPAHEERALLFCSFDAAEMPFDTYIDTLMRLPRLFERLAKERSEPSELLSLAVFPIGLQAGAHYKFIDCAHAILKPFFMECGLMLGEFHPASTVRGAHSDTFRPMRADVPLFVIRAMALHDILFIDGESTSTVMRVHELECYLRWNAGRLSPTEAQRIADRLAQRKSQLVGDEIALPA